MNRPFWWVFLIASVAFFAFVVGLTGYRIDGARQRNAAAARESLPALAEQAQSIRDAAGGFSTPQFRREMRSVFDAEPRVLLLAIHSDDGILYLVTRSRTYLKDPPEPTPDWRGTRPTL